MVFRIICLGAVLALASAGAAEFDPVAYVQSELERGAREIRVPKGRYLLDLPADRTVYLGLRGVSDVTVDFQGSELIGRTRSRMLDLRACTNTVIRNLVVDYAELPFTQAVITGIDAERNWEVRVIDGYPCPDDAGGTGDESNTWPLQAYDRDTLELRNPMRFQDRVWIAKTGPGTYRITGGKDRRGEVGDIAVWSVKDVTRRVALGSTWIEDCRGCTFEDVTVYATPHGVAFMDIGGFANTYRRCVLDRRPPETDLARRGLKRLRSGNHDAFNCRGSLKGFRVEDCTAYYHCDDCINVCGYYAVIMEGTGRRYRVITSALGSRLSAGDTAQVMTYDGHCLPDIGIVAVRRLPGGVRKDETDFLLAQRMWPGVPKTVNIAMEVELDREVRLEKGSIICSNARTGNGYVIRGNRFGRARARGIILQASDGLVEDNLIEAPFDLGIKISMSYIWLEASCGRNIVVRNNRIIRGGAGAGIWVGGTPGVKGGCLQADSHRNIAFVSNRIENCAIGIDVLGCTGLRIADNDIRAHDRRVRLANVADVAFDPVSVDPFFGPHMVLQRLKPNPVTGTAKPGERITVTYKDSSVSSVAGADGRWSVVLPPRKATREGADLVVAGGTDRAVFDDVLVGDVWLCSGQSNMELPFGAGIEGEEEAFAESVRFPNVRELKFAKVRATNVVGSVRAERPWRRAVGRGNLLGMSAVAWFFARRINAETGVPVGIWDNSWGGCSIDQYLPGGQQDLGMIEPVKDHPIAGIAWYQGESNHGGVGYGEKLSCLAAHWRGHWGEVPFYIIQLSSWSGRSASPADFKPWWREGADGFAVVRDIQRRAADAIPRSGLVVTYDVGDATDIHPRDKRTVGERLARWALRDVFGRKIEASGPHVLRAFRRGAEAVIKFDHADGGLVADGGVRGFMLAGVDGVRHQAEARIENDRIVVAAKEVRTPVEVLYAHESVPMGKANVYNREGLPASPFRIVLEDGHEK